MTNWLPDSVELYEDVQTIHHREHLPEDQRLRLYHRASRDSARTPVQWSAEKNAGFTTGTPWFFINPNYLEINVAAEEANPDSILHFYRKAISLRKQLKAVRDGVYRDYDLLSGRFYVYAMEEKLFPFCHLLVLQIQSMDQSLSQYLILYQIADKTHNLLLP